METNITNFDGQLHSAPTYNCHRHASLGCPDDVLERAQYHQLACQQTGECVINDVY